MNTQSYSLDQLTLLIPNKAVLYRTMIKKGFYLPCENSKAVSEEYLLDVIHGKIFSIKISEIKPFLLVDDISLTGSMIMHEIQGKANKGLGFSQNNLPDKHWLVNVLHTLDPENKVFKDQAVEISRTLPEG